MPLNSRSASPAPTRRLPAIVTAGGSLLTIALLTMLVLYLPLFSQEKIWWKELLDAGHIALFAAITFAAVFLFRKHLGHFSHGRVIAYGVGFLFAALLALVTEALQGLAPRDASVEDLLRNLAGSAGAIMLLAFFDQRLTLGRAWRGLLLLLTVLVITAACFDLFSWSVAYAERNQQFPRLIDFRPGWHHSFIEVREGTLQLTSLPPEFRHKGPAFVGLLTHHPGRWPGLAHREPFPDWSLHGSLVIEAINPAAEAVQVTLRVNDRQHTGAFSDRFNRVLLLQPGFNRFRIPVQEIGASPANRRMDLSDIASFSIFASEPKRPFRIYYSDFRLE